VIFWVFLTEPMRSRISFMPAVTCTRSFISKNHQDKVCEWGWHTPPSLAMLCADQAGCTLPWLGRWDLGEGRESVCTQKG
jgi:hypothetical protein